MENPPLPDPCQCISEVWAWVSMEFGRRGKPPPTNLLQAAPEKQEGLTLEEEYFTRTASSFEPQDPLQRLIFPIPDFLLKILREGEGFLAGGALNSVFTSRPIRDYDIWFPRKEALEGAKARLDSYLKGQGCEPQWRTTPHTKTLLLDGTEYQWISDRFDSPERILASFDLTVCMCGYCLKDEQLVEGPLFWEDLHQRRLRYNPESPNPWGSLLRLPKYLLRGYWIGGSDLKSLLSRLFAPDGSLLPLPKLTY